MSDHLQKGKHGEQLAREYLEQQGYSILESNWRYKKLEIDLIATDKDLLVAVEVKTRSSDAFGEPEIFVTRSKQNKLIRAINRYVKQKGCDREIRFDVVSVIESNGSCTVKLIRDAFYPKVAGSK